MYKRGVPLYAYPFPTQAQGQREVFAVYHDDTCAGSVDADSP